MNGATQLLLKALLQVVDAPNLAEAEASYAISEEGALLPSLPKSFTVPVFNVLVPCGNMCLAKSHLLGSVLLRLNVLLAGIVDHKD